MPLDYSKYPPDWKITRARILERAEHKCEACGAPNYAIIHRPIKGKPDWVLWPEGMESEAWSLDGLKATKIVLTIAHLDHDKENWEVKDDRLKAWCQRCHLSYDMPRHVANRKYGRNHQEQQTKLDI